MSNDPTGNPVSPDTQPTPIPPPGPPGGYGVTGPTYSPGYGGAAGATSPTSPANPRGTTTAAPAPEAPVEHRPADRKVNTAGVVVGLFCLIVAALVVVREQLDWQVDWEQYGPSALIGLGAVLVILGSLGLARRRSR